jgi:N-methylhydantoinase B
MQVKGKQFVGHGRRVVMAFPGGAGYGDPAARDKTLVLRDLARGYISAAVAMGDYGMTQDDVDAVADAVSRGEVL